MLNSSRDLKASSELTDWSCRFCSAKKERKISQAVLLLSRFHVSTDLKFRVNLLGLGRSVSVYPCAFAGDASTGGVHLWSPAAEAISPAQPL